MSFRNKCRLSGIDPIVVGIMCCALFLSGCCMFGVSFDDGDRVHGTQYRLHIKSDFNDSMEIVFWEKLVEHDKNEFIRMLNCYDSIYDESISTRSVHVNAFNWYDLDTFIGQGDRVAVSVNYNGKSAHYIADGAYNVFVEANDFI